MPSEPDDDGVRHADGVLRFYVPSRSVGGETHLVDLGIPTCSCRWWATSVAPALRRGERPRKMCYHYEASRRAFTDFAIKAFRDQDPNYAKTHRH